MDGVEKQAVSSPEVIDAIANSGGDGNWTTFRDDEILQQHDAIRAEETSKMPFVGDKANPRPTLSIVSFDIVSLLVRVVRSCMLLHSTDCF